MTDYDQMIRVIDATTIVSAKTVRRNLNIDLVQNLSTIDATKFFRLDVIFDSPIPGNFRISYTAKPATMRKRLLKGLKLPVNFKSPRVRGAAQEKLNEAWKAHEHLIQEAATAPDVKEKLEQLQKRGRNRFKRQKLEEAVARVENSLTTFYVELATIRADGDADSAKKMVAAVLKGCAEHMEREDLEEVWREVITEKILES